MLRTLYRNAVHKLIARFVPLCVINLVSFLSFGKSSSRAWWVQGKESQSSSKSSHTTQGLHLSSHYTTPQQTQFMPADWCLSRQNQALCSVSPFLWCSVHPGMLGRVILVLLWPRRFTVTVCVIRGRALVCSCSASTVLRQIKKALMMSGKYCKAAQTS